MKDKCADGGNHDFRKVFGEKQEVCVKCNIARELKPKRLLAVTHADGRTEYICQKCGAVMEWHTVGGMHFSAGEVWDDIEDILTCPTCGNDVIDYPKMTVKDFRVQAGA